MPVSPWIIGGTVVGSAALIGFVVYEATKKGGTTAAALTSTTTPQSSGDAPPAPAAAQGEFPIIPNPTDPNYHIPVLVDGEFYILGGLVKDGTTPDVLVSYFQANDWTNIGNVTVGSAHDLFAQIAPFTPLERGGPTLAFFCQATWHTGCAIPAGLYAIAESAYQANQNAPLA